MTKRSMYAEQTEEGGFGRKSAAIVSEEMDLTSS